MPTKTFGMLDVVYKIYLLRQIVRWTFATKSVAIDIIDRRASVASPAAQA